MELTLYDSKTIDSFQWPQTEEGQLAKRYLLPLIKEGPENFISNAKTRLSILNLGERIIPFSVNEAEYDNSYLLSTYFVIANLKEKLKKLPTWIRLFADPLVNLLGKFFKLIKINKVVIINNWLLTTNLYPDFTREELGKITHFLRDRFPDHYLMFRSIQNYKGKAVFEGLNFEKYRMIPSRHVYLYDPLRKKELSPSIIRKQKKDANRLLRSGYAVETAQTLSDGELARLLELYQNVYLSKYTKFSPIYTEKYLREAIQNKTLYFKLLKKENTIYGVAGFFQKNDYLLIPFFGYDTKLPQEESLYRMLSSVIMEEVERLNVVSHQGSGAPDFKKYRGFQELQEYVAIYDRHLPFIRRLFWVLGEKFSSKL